MRKYVIMGVQGSGKGTQSELLCQAFDLVHISVGDMFRWHVQNHTKLGAQVRRAMTAGELVGDDVVESVVWTYRAPHDAVAQIKDHVAFFADRVDSIVVHDE